MDNQLFRYREKTNLNYISLDVETSGLRLHSDLPFEISWIVVQNGEIIKKYQRFPLIKNLKMSAGAAAVTRFNHQEYLSKAEPPEKVYEDLEKYLYNDKYYIVGQNVLPYDSLIIANFQRYLGKKIDFSFTERIYDTLALGRAYKLNIPFPKDKQDILPFMYQMTGFKQRGLRAGLAALCKVFEIEEYSPETHHIGLNDTIFTDLIFRKLYWALEVH